MRPDTSTAIPVFVRKKTSGKARTRGAPQANLKARGALSCLTGRFETEVREPVDDGWAHLVDELDNGPEKLKTSVQIDRSKTIITRNQSPDIPFDRSINPYRGCEHGCIYCFARPSHAWLGLSPGLDFETRLFAKPDAPKLLRKELMRDKYSCRVLALGSNTDCYQPVERKMQITRQILEVLNAFNHPVMIVTKSPLVVRDIDILGPMAERGLAQVAVSVTTLDPKLARIMEPRTAPPQQRLDAIGALDRAGIPTTVMMAPVIPGLTDHEIEPLLKAASKSGARTARYVVLRLPREVGPLFEEWLVEHMPHRAKRVMAAVREMRDGKINDSRFGQRLVGRGPLAQLIASRFKLGCRRTGLDGFIPPLDITRFSRPQTDICADPDDQNNRRHQNNKHNQSDQLQLF